MEFLKPIDKIKLRKVLIKVQQLQTAYNRSNFLGFCGLKKYVKSLELEQPMDQFITSMITQFSDKYEIVGCSDNVCCT